MVCYDDGRDKEINRRLYMSGLLIRMMIIMMMNNLYDDDGVVVGRFFCLLLVLVILIVWYYILEVRVDVDYGVMSLSSCEIVDGEEVRLGNSIVIGFGMSVCGVMDVIGGGRWIK